MHCSFAAYRTLYCSHSKNLKKHKIESSCHFNIFQLFLCTRPRLRPRHRPRPRPFLFLASNHCVVPDLDQNIDLDPDQDPDRDPDRDPDQDPDPDRDPDSDPDQQLYKQIFIIYPDWL